MIEVMQGSKSFYRYSDPSLNANGVGTVESGDANGVTKAGVPAVEQVFLYKKQSPFPPIYVSLAKSDASGKFAFKGIDENQTYVLIAFDSAMQFNAVIRDNITPALMP